MAILAYVDRRHAGAAGAGDRRRPSSMRGLRRVGDTRRRGVPSWLHALLAVPLELKLLGANLIIVFVAVLALFGPFRLEPTHLTDALVVVASLIVGAVVSFALVRVALRPVASLAEVAWLVSEGVLGARVPASITADRDLARLAETINGLLDDLVAERAKMEKANPRSCPSRVAARGSAADALYSTGVLAAVRMGQGTSLTGRGSI